MIINGFRVSQLVERPFIDRTKRVRTRAKTVLGYGDFSYRTTFETREFEFTSYEFLKLNHDDLTIDLDGYRYYGDLIEIESEQIGDNVRYRRYTYKCLLQPFKYLLDAVPTTIGSTLSTSATTVEFNSRGDRIDSEPVLTIYATKAAAFTITRDGEEFLKLKSCPGMLIVDCRTHKLNVYDANGVVRNDLLLSDFPTLKPYNTSITVPSGVRLDINPNWRLL